MPMPFKVKNIGASKYKSRNFAFTRIYIPGVVKKGREIYTSINYKLHQVDGFKANMLVGNNVLCNVGLAINLSPSFAPLHSCDVKINITAR